MVVVAGESGFVVADASGVVVGSGAPDGVFARSPGDGGGTEGDFARGSNAGGGVAAGGALRPRRSPMMRCSGGGAGRRSAAGPGESASRRFCAPGGLTGAAPFVGGVLGVPGRGKAGGFDGMAGRMAVEAFEIAPAALEGIPDEEFVGDIDDDAFDELDGVPGRIEVEAFDELDGDPGRIDGELVSEPGRIVDESFDEPPRIDDESFDGPPRIDDESFDGPPRIDDESFDGPPRDGIFVGPLGGVPRRGGDGARDDSFSRVCPAHVSSTGGGGGNAGALSRNTFVDVMSGTPSLRGDSCRGDSCRGGSTRGDVTSTRGDVTSTRGDESSCWANGDVMSTVDVGLGSTRVAEESK